MENTQKEEEERLSEAKALRDALCSYAAAAVADCTDEQSIADATGHTDASQTQLAIHALRCFAKSQFAWSALANRKERLLALSLALFRSGLPPHLFPGYLPSLLQFISKHTGDGSALDEMNDTDEGGHADAAQCPAWSIVHHLATHAAVAGDDASLDGFFVNKIQDSGQGNQMEAAMFPAHYYIWGDLLARMADDADAHRWLQTAMASHFPVVECANMELMSHRESSERQQQMVLRRVTAAGCETNELTWLVALSQSKEKIECEQIVRVEMPQRGIRPGDAHYGFLMRHCKLEEREVLFAEFMRYQGGGGAGASVWTALITGQKCAADRESVFQRMVADGVQPMANTWGALIAGYKSGPEKERVLERMVASGMQPSGFTWGAVIAGYNGGIEREMAHGRMIASGVQPNVTTCGAVIAGYSSGYEKERAHERMVAAGVQPNLLTWGAVMAGYFKGADKEKMLERMVASGVLPNVHTMIKIMLAYSSFVDRIRVYRRMSTGPNAVTVSTTAVSKLFEDVVFPLDTLSVLDVAREFSDDLLCSHATLGQLLPLCADADDTQLLRRLWWIGASGLIDSKLGWPGLRNSKYSVLHQINKIMRVRGTQGGAWTLLSSLLRGKSSSFAAFGAGCGAANVSHSSGGALEVWGTGSAGGGAVYSTLSSRAAIESPASVVVADTAKSVASFADFFSRMSQAKELNEKALLMALHESQSSSS